MIRKAVPLGNRVVIKPDVAPDTSGAILLPDAVQEQFRSQEGEVIAVGADSSLVSLGDRVLFSKYGGHEFQSDKDDRDSFVLVMKETDIYAVVQ